jgi:uncharacterized protein (DUF1684 family)
MKGIMLATSLCLAVIAIGACDREPTTSGSVISAEPTPYEKEILEWRAGRLQRLTQPDGWLSLVGMHWIDVGTTRIGAAADNGTRLMVGPPRLGMLKLTKDDTITFEPEPGAEVTIDGEPASGWTRLVSDADLTADPTVVGFNKGDASFYVIKRGGRFALRVRDALAPTRTNFAGITYFDIDPGFRFNAKFTPHAPGSTIEIVNVLGMIEKMDNPGTVTFQDGEKSFTLEAIDEGDHRLFLVYADRTSGHESYPAARYLYSEYPDAEGNTVVDFNEGYNPPCAFTDFATCPLPPLQNRLDLAITAGEMKPAKHESAAVN